jgi:Ca2+-transporting ATPase
VGALQDGGLRAGAPRPDAWHSLPPAAVVEALGSSLENGLTSAEAHKRLLEFGPNRPPEAEPRSPLLLLAAQFRSLVVYILVAAAGVSLFLGDVVEALAVAVILLLNAGLGFFQEYRSQRALEALQSMVAPQATVVRDGQARRVDVSDLVPGDVFVLEGGDVVPADGRILQSVALRVSEALLTGESVPVDKTAASVPADTPLAERSSMVYQGTSVAAGRGVCLATATGSATEVGRVAGLISRGPEQQTPLQHRLNDVGRFLVVGAIVLCVVVFAVGVLRGIEAGDMFLTAASLAVAAIPEGLPAATTVVLALGVQRMARRNVIVRRLSSVETLGSVNVIFTDKTGTLTENRMVVEDFWAPADRDEALRAMALCNNAVLDSGGNHVGDPTEVALLQFAERSGLDPRAAGRDWRRLDEAPFDPARARMSVLAQGPGGQTRIYSKGAPESVLPLCSSVPPATAERVSAMASQGLRVLALASREAPPGEGLGEAEDGLTMVGLVGLGDPLRAEAIDALEAAAASGVRVVMLTGDHPATAAAIGRRLGLDGEIVTGRMVDELPIEELEAHQAKSQVFARVTSEHKLRIVQAARDRGDIVGMTGDGVNDAPALHAADIGIAMGEGGTDVAREAADMVLLDNSFASIVEAIRQGRTIYANIQRFVHFLLSCNLAEVSVIFLALLVWSTSPLTPLQILYVNLLTDGLPALALGFEPADPSVMTRPPRPAKSRIISRRSLVPILGIGGSLSACALAAYALGRHWGGDALGADMTLAALVGAHLGAAFVFRNESRPFFRLPLNLWLIAAVLSSALLLVAVYDIPGLNDQFHLRPLPLRETAVIAGLSLVPFLLGEAAKALGLPRRFNLLPDGV